jgi:hypothetical protein
MVNQRLQAVDPRIIVLLLFGAFIIIRHIPKPPSAHSNPPISNVFWVNTTADDGNFYDTDIERDGWSSLYKRAGLHFPPNSVLQWPPTNFSAYNIRSKKAPEEMVLPPEAAPFLFKPIPINTASPDLLTIIPGIGKKMAAEIYDYRQKHGSIKDLNDLGKIHGIGPLKKKYIVKFISF